MSLAPILRKLIKDAHCDSDPVSMYTTGTDENREELAVVVLKGAHTIELFRQWATRTGALTHGKPVKDITDPAKGGVHG